MRNAHRVLVGLILSVLALGFIVPHGVAQIHYRAGIEMGPYDHDYAFERPGVYHFTLLVVVYPLWYVSEGLDTYDTVTLTLRLTSYRTLSGSMAILTGDNCLMQEGGALQCTWKNVHLSQDEYGITLDAAIRLNAGIIVDPDSALGTYELDMSAIATAGPDVTFEGSFSMPIIVYG